MEKLDREKLEKLSHYKPVPWENLPDFGLYMDQVISFITRTYQPLYGDASEGYLSAAMINNYVKAKLLPRPVGKKYNREQLALLMMIVALKQVASMEDIRRMLAPAEGLDVSQLYTHFCARQQHVVDAVVQESCALSEDLPPAVNFAILSSGYRAGFEALLRQSPGGND